MIIRTSDIEKAKNIRRYGNILTDIEYKVGTDLVRVCIISYNAGIYRIDYCDGNLVYLENLSDRIIK